MKDQQENKDEKKEAGYYFNLKEVLTYYFRKKDPNRPIDTNLKMMHGINKISIIMFLIAVIVMVVRVISRF
ncbi:MAG: hypothetical protein CMJ19_03305 [Phycisphaeraceae bacterium]|nr:hypothetical protein [Phycisphaeraceae bacterium]